MVSSFFNGFLVELIMKDARKTLERFSRGKTSMLPPNIYRQNDGN